MDKQSYKVCLLGEVDKDSSFQTSYIVRGREVKHNEKNSTHFEYLHELDKKMEVQVLDYTGQDVFGSWCVDSMITKPDLFVITVKNLTDTCNIRKVLYIADLIRKIDKHVSIILYFNTKGEGFPKDNHNWSHAIYSIYGSKHELSLSIQSNGSHLLDDLIVRTLLEKPLI